MFILITIIYIDTCHELCKSLLSIEVQNFIDNLDVKAPLVITFPSKLITIAHLMMLQSKFGIPITVDIIAQALKIKVDSSLVQFIRNKIRFVKKGIMTYFKKYTNESCKHFLLSPYRTTEGNLKNLLKVRPKEIKKKTTTDVDVTSEKGKMICLQYIVLNRSNSSLCFQIKVEVNFIHRLTPSSWEIKLKLLLIHLQVFILNTVVVSTVLRLLK
jgi:hypothetical protein